MTIYRKITGRVSIQATQKEVDNLKNATLSGCPFKNYSAMDLLTDLISMYSWQIPAGYCMEVVEFIKLCNDIHATAYKNILLGL